MAGFNFSPIKVDTPPQTSLGDMLNIARGAQAYGQAQQLNPLAVEKAKADLSLSQTQAQKAQRTLEYDVAHAKAIANTAISQANDAQLENIKKQQANSSRNLIKMLDSPEPITPDRIKDHVVATMQNAGATDQAIIQAVQGLPTAGTDKELRAFVAKHALNSLTAEAELDKRFPAATLVQEGPTTTPRQIGSEAFTGVKPGTAVGEPIKLGLPPGTITVGGLVGQYNAKGEFVPFAVQPSTQTTPPNNAPAPQANKPTAEKMPPLVQLDQPSASGQLNSRELDRYNDGKKDWENSTERAVIARDSGTDAAILKKSLASAAGNKPGQVVRDVNQFLFGDPQKDILVKTLAANAVRQSALMGVKNEAAGQDVKVANGTEQVTAEALAHIIERIESTNLASEKYNQALTKMQEKHGKDKTYLNNDNFKKAWASNYDPVAFIIQNVNRQNIPQKDKDKIIDYYIHDMSDEQKSDLATRMKNLKRLERGDL